MKIKRFIAASMREAIRLVREEQGEDAVILANRRVEGGVEVVAATDYDAALIQQAVNAPAMSTMPPSPTPPPAPRATQSEPPPPPPPIPSAAWFAHASAPAQPAPSQAATLELDALKREMAGLRTMMQQHLAGLAWNDLK